MAQIKTELASIEPDFHPNRLSFWHSLNRNHWHNNSEITGINRTGITKQIHFRQHTGNVTEEVLMRYWIKAQQQLINLFHTALLDYTIQQQKMNQKKVTERVITVLDKEGVDAIRLELKNYKKKVRNWSLFALLLIISSLMIWIFFMYSDWDWYLSHPKKLGITLMVNLALLIIFLNVPLKSKWLIWISIIVPILIALFSIL